MKSKPTNAPGEDENLRRMLKTPPKPHADMKVHKAKASRVSRAKSKKSA